MTGHDGYDDISVAAAGGTSPEQLKAAIAARARARSSPCAPARSRPRSRRRTSRTRSASSARRCSCSPAWRCSSARFLIFNTFSVTVAQRTKEFALLRTLGASRGQVLRSVLAETFVIGVLASLLGIAAGWLLAPALAALLASFGLDLGSTSTVLEPRTDRSPAWSSASSPPSSRASCPPAAPRGSSPWRRCATASRPASGACAGGGSWSPSSSRRSASRCCSTGCSATRAPRARPRPCSASARC